MVNAVFVLLLASAAASALLPVLLQPAGGCGMPVAAGFGAGLFLTLVAMGTILFDALMRAIWNRIVDYLEDPPR